MLRYHPQHSWVRIEDGQATVGLSSYAREQLGEILYIDLPQEGQRLSQGLPFCEIESAKTTAELLAPLSGPVKTVNLELDNHIDWLNQSPLDQGWICRVEISDPAELGALLDEAAYLAQAAAEEER